jgi:hypothetical protein
VTFKAKDFMKGLSFRPFIRISGVDFTICRADLLTDSTFIDDLDHITECFDKTTKPRFRNADDPQYIKFGGTRDNDPSCGIRFGQLKIAGYIISLSISPIGLLNICFVFDEYLDQTSPNSFSPLSTASFKPLWIKSNPLGKTYR